MKSIILFLVLLVSISSLASNNIVCRGYYYDVKSIDFGMLFRETKDIETMEALNKMSKANMFMDGEPNEELLLNHMIDTILFYRAFQGVSHIYEIPEAFKNFDIQFFHSEIDREAKGKNAKFNFFKEHIEQGF